MGLYALTLWPEWAWAILIPDPMGKRCENRTWAPDARLRPGHTLALHAGVFRGSRNGHEWASRLHDVANAAYREQARLEHIPGALKSPVRLHVNHHPRDKYRLLLDWHPIPAPTGAVVALATYLGCDREQRTGWDVPGQWHWRLGDVRPLAEHVPCRGAQGLWRLPDDLALECSRRADPA